jgi:anti-anti-sigma factor
MADLPPYLFVEVSSSSEDQHLVSVRGELDLAGADYLRCLLLETAGSTVVLDLSELRLIDAAGIGAVVEAEQEIRRRGHRLEIRGARGIVARVFEICNLDWMIGR